MQNDSRRAMGVCGHGGCNMDATRVISEMVDLGKAWREVSADEVEEFDLGPYDGDPFAGKAGGLVIPTGQQRRGCDKHTPPPFRPMLMVDTVKEMRRLHKPGLLTARRIQELREAQ